VARQGVARRTQNVTCCVPGGSVADKLPCRPVSRPEPGSGGWTAIPGRSGRSTSAFTAPRASSTPMANRNSYMPHVPSIERVLVQAPRGAQRPVASLAP
jgi:hypothetical protein